MVQRVLFCCIAALLSATGAAHAVDLSRITFNGFVDMEYTQSSNSQFDTPGSNASNGAFHQHHLSFLMDVPVDDRVSGHFHIEFDHGVNTSAAAAGDIIVEKSFIQYTHNDLLQFRFGKVLTPFGYYNEIHDATPAFLSVFIPHPIYRQERRGGTSMFPKWTTGVNILGAKEVGATVCDYILYVGNGENLITVNEAEHDSNRNKAVGGRVSVQPGEVLTVALSFYSGEKAVSSGNAAISHNTYGIMTSANMDQLNMVAEYGRSAVGTIVDTGWYVQASYDVRHNLTPYLRYEKAAPNDAVGNDAWSETILGINLKPTPNLILKFEMGDNVRESGNIDIGTDPVTGAAYSRNFIDYRFAVTLFF